MSHFLSCKIADFLVYQQQIPEEEWEIYQYGYDTLIYSIEQTILLLLLGLLFHQLTGTLLYLKYIQHLQQVQNVRQLPMFPIKILDIRLLMEEVIPLYQKEHLQLLLRVDQDSLKHGHIAPYNINNKLLRG